MQIIRGETCPWTSAYNIFCKSAFALDDDHAHNPFALTACVIDPLSFTTHHQHDDQEIFLIKSGTGLMTIDNEEEEVSAGDSIFIPSNSTHSLKNLSPKSSLEFYSISWLGPRTAAPSKFHLVIPAPPTPNGPLHLGHLSGPYLAADVFNRYQKMRGSSSLLFIYTDDHQCYISNKARELGLANDNVLTRFRPLIQSGLSRFDIDADLFFEPRSNDEYVSFVGHFFQRLVNKNIITLRPSKTIYCPNSHKYIYGADALGLCPHCHSSTLAHGCEVCGHYNDGHDLLNLRSGYGAKPVSIETNDRYYFSLEPHREFLHEFLSRCAMHPRLRSYYQDYFARALPDVTASNFSNWGIDASGAPGQKIYEWIEMAGAMVYWQTQAQKRFGIGDYALDFSLAFGFDNSFFYGLVVPALMRAYDANLALPKSFLSNYFYQLNHEKFSTSRNHAIWALDILDRVSADPLRLYLALTRSEHHPTNFTMQAFRSFVETVFNTRWQQFFSDLNLAISSTNFGEPAAKKMFGYQERFSHDTKIFLWKIDEAYGVDHSINQASLLLIQCLDHMADYFYRYRHTSSEFLSNLRLVLSGVRDWLHALSPIMPTFCGNLIKAFGSHAHMRVPTSLFDMRDFNNSEREMKALE